MSVSRFIVIHRASNRIVATCGGTHNMMERIVDRLDRLAGRHPGTYMYDDYSHKQDYAPQVGPNASLQVPA